MKSLLLHLKSDKGETLVETLVALLIAIMSMALLASALVSASNINAKAREQAAVVNEQISSAETDSGSKDPAGSLIIAGTTYGSNDGLAFAGGTYVSSFQFQSSGFRQAIAAADKVLEDNKDAWKDLHVWEVIRAYVNEVGAENVHMLTKEELGALLDSSPLYQSGGYAGYNYYLLPSCTYVNGEPLDFQIINAATPSAGAPFANDGNLRPIGYLYNGKFYGCFNKVGQYIMGGQYMGSWGGLAAKDLDKIHLGTGGYTLDFWFQNTDRPGAVGDKNGNGVNSIILVPGGVY